MKTRYFFIGLAVGMLLGLSVFFIHTRVLRKTEAAIALLTISDQASLAIKIYNGDAKEWADLIHSRIPEMLDNILSNPYTNEIEGRDWSLWAVHDLYLTTGTPIPPEYEPILKNLTPKPDCTKIRRIQ
jgi:hypothetical protein